MTEQIKKTSKDLKAVGRGIKKFWGTLVAVTEAFAWIGLLATSYAVIFHQLNGYIALEDIYFYLVVVSTAVITVRFAFEGAAYLRKLGYQYES